jgi:hypothetical protein
MIAWRFPNPGIPEEEKKSPTPKSGAFDFTDG